MDTLKIKGSATSDSIGPRFALLGDAAHRVHPMAGQGANMGYRDIEVLLDTIETYYTNGTDPYSELCLEDYQRQINLEHGPMMAGIESLKELVLKIRAKILCAPSLNFFQLSF